MTGWGSSAEPRTVGRKIVHDTDVTSPLVAVSGPSVVKSVPEPAGKHDEVGPEGGGLPSSPPLELDEVLEPPESSPDTPPDPPPDAPPEEPLWGLPGPPEDELG